MCGIAGWVGVGHPDAHLAEVRSAGEALEHRGPDDSGVLVLSRHDVGRLRRADGSRHDIREVDPDLESSVIIAHRRLEIIDPGPTGAQPMPTADETLWIAYNGEIYNHIELRNELEREGVLFRGRSDTEVVLEAYRQWGADCFRRFAGMFAVVVVDRVRRRIVLARDHLGQKPLFLRWLPDGLAFASEIPALALIGDRCMRVAEGPTVDYLATGRTDHRSDTMIEGIHRLDPGTVLEIEDPTSRSHQVRHFWSIPGERSVTETHTLEEAAARFREIFLRSVAWHLRSDVPTGSLLSGGLDSSAIVVAQRETLGPAAQLRAVSYLGSDGAANEEPWIDLVTAAARCTTAKLRVDREVWTNALSVAVRQGEPMGSPAILVHNALCRLAREIGVKVLLDGQGADELLAGYPSAIPVRIAALMSRGEIGLAWRLAESAGQVGLGGIWRTSRLILSAARPTLRLPRRRLACPWLSLDADIVENICGPVDRPASLSALVRGYLGSTLPAILRWEDRNAMDASVESRLPFMLPELVTFCLSLPDQHLLGYDGESKLVMRRAVADLVPAAVLDRRRKVGLSVPLLSWARNIRNIAERLEEMQDTDAISSSWLRLRLSELRGDSRIDSTDLFVIWRLVGFSLWREALGVASF